MNTVADAIVQTLVRLGVGRAHGTADDDSGTFRAALERSRQLEWKSTHSVAAALLAAHADALTSGSLAVSVTAAEHTQSAVAARFLVAESQRAAVLALVVDVGPHRCPRIDGSNFDGREDVYPIGVAIGRIPAPEDVVLELEAAARTAVEDSRLVILHVDACDLLLPAGARPAVSPPPHPRQPIIYPDDHDLDHAASILNRAERVTILAGSRLSGAHSTVMSLASVLQAPIAYVLPAKEQIAYDNPFEVGLAGQNGHASAASALNDADLVVLLGADAADIDFCPDRSTVVSIDPERGASMPRHPSHLRLHGTVTHVLQRLLPRLLQHLDTAHLNRSTTRFAHLQQVLEGKEEARTGAIPSPDHVISAVNALAESNTVFTAEPGDCLGWTGRSLRMNGSRRLIAPRTVHSYSAALALAIGAQSADIDRQVIAFTDSLRICGALGELATLRLERLPVKVVVFNRDSTPAFDLVGVARSFGFSGKRASHRDDITEALSAAFDYDGPALIDIAVDVDSGRLTRRSATHYRARTRQAPTS